MKYAPGGRGPIGALKYDIVPITRGKVLEIGRGPFKVWPHFVGLRLKSDDTIPPSIAPDIVVESFDDLGQFRDDGFDAVVIHGGIERTQAMAAELIRIVRHGGYVITAIDGAPLIEQMIHGQGIVPSWFPWERDPDDSDKRPTACVVRYGAIGDSMQAAAIIASLHADGFSVTVMCEPLGYELLKCDPHIDNFLVQDKDQVPNQELHEFITHVGARYDRLVNLCESVEGTLLLMHRRSNFYWPKDLRHERCNVNYGEFMAKIAGIAFRPEHHFYPSYDEQKAAEARIDEIADQANPGWVMGQKWVRPYVIMWALSGSAVHKVYPHQDSVMARILLEIPHAHIITVGDEASKILEVGWENEPRVHCMAGELEIRETIALAQKCDLVIGPETGVLNAVAFEPMPKIVLLSHSTEENLTKHWESTEAIATEGTPCYPCHQLHYQKTAWQTCMQHDDLGVSECQWNIKPDRVWAAVQRAYTATGAVRRLLENA